MKTWNLRTPVVILSESFFFPNTFEFKCCHEHPKRYTYYNRTNTMMDILEFKLNSRGGCRHGWVTFRFLFTLPPSTHFYWVIKTTKWHKTTKWIDLNCCYYEATQSALTSLQHSLTEHSRFHVVEVSSWSWSKEKLNRMLLGQEFEEQASGMKGRSCTTGHKPLELTKHRITSMVKAMFPKACPEICRKHRKCRDVSKWVQEMCSKSR